MSKKTRTKTNKAGKLMKCDGQMLKKVIEAKGYKCHELSKMLRYCSDYLTTCCRTNKISDVAAKYLMDYKIFPQMYDLEGEIKVGQPEEVKIDKDEKKIEFGTPYGIVRSEKDLRKYIRRCIPIDSIGPHWGTDLLILRDILEKARANGLSYDVEDMRNDMIVYAGHVGKYSEKWVEFVNHLDLKYESDYRRSPFAPTAQEAKEILNRRYGSRLENGSVMDSLSGKDFDGDMVYINAAQEIKKKINDTYGTDSDMHMLVLGLKYFFKGMMKEAKNDPEIKAMIKQAVKEAYEEL